MTTDWTLGEAYKAAQYCAAVGRYGDAIVAYSAAISKCPDYVVARVGRGLSFQAIGKHLNAIADFDHVIESHSDWPSAFMVYYSRAVSQQALGRLESAMFDCNEALIRNPKSADALYLRGKISKTIGHFEMAARDMDEVLRVDPSYSEAFLERGKLNVLLHCWGQAVADLTVALLYASSGRVSVRECHYLRGVAAQAIGDHSAAIEDFSKTIELAPDDAAGYLRRSWSYDKIGAAALAATDRQEATERLRTQGREQGD